MAQRYKNTLLYIIVAVLYCHILHCVLPGMMLHCIELTSMQSPLPSFNFFFLPSHEYGRCAVREGRCRRPLPQSPASPLRNRLLLCVSRLLLTRTEQSTFSHTHTHISHYSRCKRGLGTDLPLFNVEKPVKAGKTRRMQCLVAERCAYRRAKKKERKKSLKDSIVILIVLES